MASATNPSGMEFEVFLSFRGPDTRENFTSYLYHDMVEKGIRVFKDDKELQVGEKIEKLLQALNNSQIYIPIFSKDFASSAWCLREVAHMVDCTLESEGKKEILPLFLDVKPEDVKLKTEWYRDALSKHEEEYGPHEVNRWRDALREVATRVGWKPDGKESGELIKLIVREVLLKLKVKNRSLPNNLVEMADEDDIEELLKVDSVDHVRVVIIYGTGGIGKSTLASVIFNRFRSQFDCSSFLENVQDLSQRHGLVDVQKNLLSDTLGPNSTVGILDTNAGIDRIKKGLGNKKVLVVVDNVNEKKQFENLTGSHTWFGPGSRIIVTLRDRRTIPDRKILHEDKQTQPSCYIEYPVKEMLMDRAVQLFSKHAFRSNTPPEEWQEFSYEVVSSIGRLPLTLEVVGSLFASTDKLKWGKTLKDLKQVPCDEVQETLMICVKKLDFRKKEIFLDIACFCIGEDKMNGHYMWDDCGYSPHSALGDLLLMSLIKIDEKKNTFWMHDEVRDLGRYIVKEEHFKDAGNCHWLVIDGNNLDMLSNKKEKRAVRALNLNISHVLKAEELACLPTLRFLGGQGLNFEGNFENLLYNLRWLSWHRCSLDFSAMNLHLVNLLVLDLSKSDITHDWVGWRQIEMAKKLKVLNLAECYKLTKTPDFSKFGKLETLILKWCCNLSMIDSSIGKVKLLSTLKIKGCSSLQGLPKEIGSLEYLSQIITPDGDESFELPETLGNLKSLTTFEIYSNINQLPNSIGRLNLTHLVLHSCENLRELPNSIGDLKSLVKLSITYSRISVLPYTIGRLKHLKYLLLTLCEHLHELPNSIGELESLVELDLKSSLISVLPDSIRRLTSLTHLSLCQCKNLLKLPDSIGELKALVKLDLDDSGISILPDSIRKLNNLKHLLLSYCENLYELPDSMGQLKALVELNLNGTRISILPYSIGRLKNLKHLLLINCKNLYELPNCMGQLEALVELNLNVTGISILPDSIGRLKNLKHLRLSNCKNLYELPDSIWGLEPLVELDLKLSPISIIRDSIGRLTNLTHLSLSKCGNLLEIPGSGEPESLVKFDIRLFEISTLLKYIRRLSCIHLCFSRCTSLHELLDSIGQMELLVELDLKYLGISLLPDSIGNLKKLKVLKVAQTKISTIPCALGLVETLEELDASFCPHLMDEIPWEMWSLTRLRILDLDGSPISTVPRMIHGFSSLQTLKIASSRLSPLPKLPSSLKCLVVAAAKFPVLPDLSNLVHLHQLEVHKLGMTFWVSAEVTSPWKDMQSINRLPLSLSTLKLHSIPQLPDNYNFQSLLILSISKCLTAHLPDLWHSKGLQELQLNDFPELVEIPSLGELESLKFLQITMCDVIKQLPNLSKLKNLLRLELKHCAKLTAIEGLKELNFLEYVEIRFCMSLERLPDVPAPIKLETDWMPPKPIKHTIQPAKRLRLSLD